MTRFLKKVLSLSLAFIMVFGMVPVSAHASDQTEDGNGWICDECGEFRTDAGFCESCDKCISCCVNTIGCHCEQCGACLVDNPDVCVICENVCKECCESNNGGFCDICEMCMEHAIENNAHCHKCEACLSDGGTICEYGASEFGDEEGCIACCVEEGYHCEDCGAHCGNDYDLWCPDCGPGTHCVACIDHGGVCQNCDKIVCFESGEDGFCLDCLGGACADCIEENDLHCQGCGDCLTANAACVGCADENGHSLCLSCASGSEWHCRECGEHIGDNYCYCPEGETHCYNCAEASGVHNCKMCTAFYCGISMDNFDNFCLECDACIECCMSEGEHCADCERCFSGETEECPDNGDLAYCYDCCISNGFHCENCEKHVEDDEWCPDCGEGTHCKECMVEDGMTCEECNEVFCTYYDSDVVCDSCGKCPECAIHCPECNECIEEMGGWCEEGGEESHCLSCCEENDWICENCNRCTAGANLEKCDYCGHCEDCCHEASENAGCESGNICVENSEFDDHLCTNCKEKCACESEICIDCGLCEDCEATKRTQKGCNHTDAPCPDSYFWKEHYCTECAHCFENCNCDSTCTCEECKKTDHTHEHNFIDGVCEECLTSEDGRPVIKEQPKDANCIVNAPGSTENKAEFSVKAYGDGLAYRWYLDGEPIYDSAMGTGFNTAKATFYVPSDACHETHEVYCVVTNEEGEAESEKAKFKAVHKNAWVYENEQYHSYRCIGEDCTEILRPNLAHTYGSYVNNEYGNRVRICSACEHEKQAPLSGTPVKEFAFSLGAVEFDKDAPAPIITSEGAYIESYRWYEKSPTKPAPKDGKFEGERYYCLEIEVHTVNNRPLSDVIKGKINGLNMSLVDMRADEGRATFMKSFYVDNKSDVPPLFALHPQSVTKSASDMSDPESYKKNVAKFRVKIANPTKEDTFQWFISKYEGDFVEAVEGVDGTGLDTANATFFVPFDSCGAGIRVACRATNEYGERDSESAELIINHRKRYVSVSGDEHIRKCVGCDAKFGEQEYHTYEQEVVGTSESTSVKQDVYKWDEFGGRYKECTKCKYREYDSVLPYISEFFFEVTDPAEGLMPSQPLPNKTKHTEETFVVTGYEWIGEFNEDGSFIGDNEYTLNFTIHTVGKHIVNHGTDSNNPRHAEVNGYEATFGETNEALNVQDFSISFTAGSELVSGKAIITKQPVNFSAKVMDELAQQKATFSIEAKGSNEEDIICYEWHAKRVNSTNVFNMPEYAPSSYDGNNLEMLIPSAACKELVEVWCEVWIFGNYPEAVESDHVYMFMEHNFKCLPIYNDGVSEQHETKCVGWECGETKGTPHNHRYITQTYTEIVTYEGQNYEETREFNKSFTDEYDNRYYLCRDCGYKDYTEALSNGEITAFAFTAEEPIPYGAPKKPFLIENDATENSYISSYWWGEKKNSVYPRMEPGETFNPNGFYKLYVEMSVKADYRILEGVTATVNDEAATLVGIYDNGRRAIFEYEFQCPASAGDKPVITKNPVDFKALMNFEESYSEDNKATFSVSASSDSGNLTYQWYTGTEDRSWESAIDENWKGGMAEGFDTNTLSFIVPTDACYTDYIVWCEVTANDQTTTSNNARLIVEHEFVCQSEGPDTHISRCRGDGCNVTDGESKPHAFTSWKADKYGNETRNCRKCNRKESYALDTTNPVTSFEFKVARPVAGESAEDFAPVILSDGAYIRSYFWKEGTAGAYNQAEALDGEFEPNKWYRLFISATTMDNRPVGTRVGTINGKDARYYGGSQTSVIFYTDYQPIINDTNSYIMTVTPAGKNFIKLTEGYNAQQEELLTIKNVGTGTLANVDITMGGANPACFEANDTATKESLTKNEKTDFTLRPTTGLTSGSYSATVSITADKLPRAQMVTAKVLVAPEKPKIHYDSLYNYNGTTITISCSTPDAVIHYTTDGSTPNKNSPVYEGPIFIPGTETVSALAIKNSVSSDVSRVSFSGNLIPIPVSEDSDSRGSGKGREEKVDIDQNGGAGVPDISGRVGEEIDLDDYTPTRDGYEFTGWYSDPELTKRVYTIRIGDNTALYAGWVKATEETNPNTGLALNALPLLATALFFKKKRK